MPRAGIQALNSSVSGGGFDAKLGLQYRDWQNQLIHDYSV
jgi:hypothetical protein